MQSIDKVGRPPFESNIIHALFKSSSNKALLGVLIPTVVSNTAVRPTTVSQAGEASADCIHALGFKALLCLFSLSGEARIRSNFGRNIHRFLVLERSNSHRLSEATAHIDAH